MPSNNSRLTYGSIIINHKGKKIPTSVGSLKYESAFSTESLSTNAHIPPGYEHRPDLISSLFMDDPDMWWVICERNAIFDVFEQLNSGDSIGLPL